MQRLQGNYPGIQVKDPNAVCKPQRQEQPRLAQKRYSRRYTRPDVCKNEQPGLSSPSNDRPTLLSERVLQEMASEERKAADAKIEEDNLFLSLGAADKQAETDAFQCGRCKQV